MISRYLRSACCDAPVVQTYEPGADLFPIRCRACRQELGAPGAEDIPDAALRIMANRQFVDDMVTFKIRHLFAAMSSVAAHTFIKITGV